MILECGGTGVLRYWSVVLLVLLYWSVVVLECYDIRVLWNWSSVVLEFCGTGVA